MCGFFFFFSFFFTDLSLLQFCNKKHRPHLFLSTKTVVFQVYLSVTLRQICLPGLVKPSRIFCSISHWVKISNTVLGDQRAYQNSLTDRISKVRFFFGPQPHQARATMPTNCKLSSADRELRRTRAADCGPQAADRGLQSLACTARQPPASIQSDTYPNLVNHTQT